MSYAQERKKKIEATGVEGMKSAGKTNDEEATLRKGNLPKAEAVRTLSHTVNAGACVAAAKKQNCSDGGTIETVLPTKSINAPPDTHGCEK